MNYLRLGQILIDEEIITEEQLNEALEHQKLGTKRLGRVIMDMNLASEVEILKALAKRLNINYVNAPLFDIAPEVLKFVPESFARKYMIVPLNLTRGVLTIAMNDPLDFNCMEDLRMITGFEIKAVISPESEILIAINRIYSKQSADDLLLGILSERSDLVETSDEALAASVDSAPIVKLVNNLIMDAYHQNASDIHIEPTDLNTQVRYRVNGDLMKHSEFTSDIHQLISTRIKIIAGMNIAEKRVPQDGSFKFKNDLVNIDIRVSSIPTTYGEKLVLRLLGADKNINYQLASLGFSKEYEEIINRTIRLPHGIILVTGPTGSGKTTTLYSMLSKISDVTRAIVTIEDPIEKKFNGITQVQVNNKAGLTFASGLRSILRQDPDIIMVGEIRDGETAQIAIRAAITGHLVLSTIHTNDALSTVVRLIDMGTEPYLVASSVKCVISQRLVKTVCPKCKAKHKVTQEENLALNTELTTSYKGAGCVDCNSTGYSGRTAVFEILLLDAELQEMVSRVAPMDELKKYVEDSKMRMLRDEVLDLVTKGTTSVEEAIRLLYTVD